MDLSQLNIPSGANLTLVEVQQGGTNIQHVEHYHTNEAVADPRRAALQCMESHIRAQLAKDPFNRRLVLLPLVAAIRAELVPNVMKVTEFNEEFCTDISPATFSEYVPKEICNSKISEDESAPYEMEYKSLLK